MKLPPDVQFEEDLSLFVWKPRGVIDEAGVRTIIAFLEAKEAASEKPFDRYVEIAPTTAFDLEFKFVFDASLMRRLSYSERAPVKAAILVSDVNNAHYAKMHALITKGSPLKIRVFEDRSEAALWLGVPAQRLEN